WRHSAQPLEDLAGSSHRQLPVITESRRGGGVAVVGVPFDEQGVNPPARPSALAWINARPGRASGITRQHALEHTREQFHPADLQLSQSGPPRREQHILPESKYALFRIDLGSD